MSSLSGINEKSLEAVYFYSKPKSNEQEVKCIFVMSVKGSGSKRRRILKQGEISVIDIPSKVRLIVGGSDKSINDVDVSQLTNKKRRPKSTSF